MGLRGVLRRQLWLRVGEGEVVFVASVEEDHECV